MRGFAALAAVVYPATRGGRAITPAQQLHESPFSGVTAIDDTCRVMRALADQHGIPDFSYLNLGRHADSDRFIASYPLEWRQRYEQKLYIHYDPVVAVARHARLPYFWNNAGFLSPFRKAERKVFHEAGDYGINTGYSIPIPGKTGGLGLFSVAARTEASLIEAVDRRAHLIFVLALQVHDHVLSLGSEKDVACAGGIELTARELECLKWAAEGLSTDQIADRLAISPATVNYHFSKIVPKFDAANRHHAAIKAVRLGLI